MHDGSLENENHVIYLCPRYNDLGLQHASLLEHLSTLAGFLNPAEVDMKETASSIRGILNSYSCLNSYDISLQMFPCAV